ncbi:MAG: hypothetical protein IMX01_08360 [Limnochordaceae bacterium]|nr:hypothetical protein [Limnochordaceae bacterium]
MSQLEGRANVSQWRTDGGEVVTGADMVATPRGVARAIGAFTRALARKAALVLFISAVMVTVGLAQPAHTVLARTGAAEAQASAEASPRAGQAIVTAELVAVQMPFRVEAYQDADTLFNYLDGILVTRLQPANGTLSSASRQRLIAFPEDVGLPTVFTGELDALQGVTSVEGAVARMLERHQSEAASWLAQGVSPVRAVLLARNQEMARTYFDVFSRLARRWQAWVVAGSIPLPDYAALDQALASAGAVTVDVGSGAAEGVGGGRTAGAEAGKAVSVVSVNVRSGQADGLGEGGSARPGSGADASAGPAAGPGVVSAGVQAGPGSVVRVKDLVPRSAEVYNVSYVFGPDGRVYGKQKKVHLIELEGPALLDLTPGDVSELRTVSTPAGRIGVAICLDAFRSDVRERLREQGAQILVQPSANPGPWSAAQQRDWLGSAWQAVAQGEFAYALNPMMNGQLLGVGFWGQSAIFGRRKQVQPSQPSQQNQPQPPQQGQPRPLQEDQPQLPQQGQPQPLQPNPNYLVYKDVEPVPYGLAWADRDEGVDVLTVTVQVQVSGEGD